MVGKNGIVHVRVFFSMYIDFLRDVLLFRGYFTVLSRVQGD